MVNYANFCKETYSSEPKSVLEGYDLIKEHSTNESLSYRKGNDIVFAVRGTKDMSKDLVTDLAIGIGSVGQTKRYKNEKKRLTNLIDDFPKHSVIICGHSLGGAICIRLLQEKTLFQHIVACHVYNPGSSLLGLKDKVLQMVVCKLSNIPQRCKAGKKLHIHRHLVDPLSVGSLLEPSNSTEILPAAGHSINAFVKGKKLGKTKKSDTQK